MTHPDSRAQSTGAPAITVVGIGADGWDGLAPASSEALRKAEVVIGSSRQLGLLPSQVRAERVPWPSPLRPSVRALLDRYAGRRPAVLASGDPMHFGIGRALVEEVGPDRLRVLPHPSSVSLACARLGWAVEDTQVVSLVGRSADSLWLHVYPGRRLLVLSADGSTPQIVAGALTARGYGPTRLRVLESLGSTGERIAGGTAQTWADGDSAALNVAALNIVALDCATVAGAVRLGLTPGLPDTAYDSDGQLTKREVRAVTLAALAPAPGELLWDVGGGSGSIGIEWMRSHPSCRAICIEPRADRVERIVANANALGVPGLQVVTGWAPDALAELPSPEAIFVGGGITTPGLVDACWAALQPGGRLVANTVTLESEAVLTLWHTAHGGDLTRIAIAHAAPVGGLTGWRPAMPVTQWSALKPRVPSPTSEAVS